MLIENERKEKMRTKYFDGPQKIVEAFLRFKVKTETDNYIK